MKAIVLLLLLLSPFAGAAPTPIAAFVDDYAAKHHFSGSILIERAGRVELRKSYGLADIAAEIPNTPATRYKIASVTKLFTSVLVMQLQEQGRIALDQTIRHYLPDYPGAGVDVVTIQQLLNHTSGIDTMEKFASADDAIDNGMPVFQVPMTSDQLLQRYASGKLVSTPGSTFAYNNADYVVLGKIIERITGQSFDQILRQRILQPLGMANSGMLRQRDIVGHLAPTYFTRAPDDSLSNDLPVYPENWYAAGAMYSTLDDLRRFSTALFDARLVGKPSLQRMFRPGLDDYGYGLWSYDMKIAGQPRAVVKRPGRIMGAQTQLFHRFEPALTVIILANTDRADLDEFVVAVARHVVD